MDAGRDRVRAHNRPASAPGSPYTPYRLDSVAFTDTTWFGRGGYFHSANLRVVEKFTRKGDEILYEVTVEDPDVLVEPWVMAPRTLRPNRAPDAGLIPERAYCEVYEREDRSTQIRH